MLLLRCMILIRLLQRGLMWMLWLLRQLVLFLLILYASTLLLHPMFPLHAHHPPLPLSVTICQIVNHHDMLEGNVFDCMQSLGTFRWYDPFLDPYNLYLGSMPAKILFTIAFNQSTDFSKACDKFRRALTIILRFMFKCSYSHSFELHAHVFDKLTRALTASELAA